MDLTTLEFDKGEVVHELHVSGGGDVGYFVKAEIVSGDSKTIRVKISENIYGDKFYYFINVDCQSKSVLMEEV